MTAAPGIGQEVFCVLVRDLRPEPRLNAGIENVIVRLWRSGYPCHLLIDPCERRNYCHHYDNWAVMFRLLSNAQTD